MEIFVKILKMLVYFWWNTIDFLYDGEIGISLLWSCGNMFNFGGVFSEEKKSGLKHLSQVPSTSTCSQSGIFFQLLVVLGGREEVLGGREGLPPSLSRGGGVRTCLLQQSPTPSSLSKPCSPRPSSLTSPPLASLPAAGAPRRNGPRVPPVQSRGWCRTIWAGGGGPPWSTAS